ncbi:MAG: NADP-dependent malic enzyme, partial [Deltaproteobacteria bacterium]|nr:NADP-dependent malic enzyme [Nannocystaceae bacterium]
PFDPRVLYWVAPAVARAAVESGVAAGPFDEDAYVEHLRTLLGQSSAVLRKFVRRAATDPRRVVFPEAEDPRILQACSILLDEHVAVPILIGSPKRIEEIVRSRDIDLDLSRCEIVHPITDPALAEYATSFYEQRQRKGMGRRSALKLMRDSNYFALMMVKQGRADAVVTGLLAPYSETIRPALQIIGTAPGVRRAAGMYLMLHHQRGILFFGDTTVNTTNDAETLADVAELLADAAKTFEVEPRIAMLSMSNFGSVQHRDAAKVAAAVKLLRARRPDLEVEGEMQGNLAVDFALQQRTFPFSRMTGAANVLVFPNLDAGNVAYKLVRELGGITSVGPVLLGMARPVTVLERDAEVDTIVLMTALTVVDAQQQDARRLAAQ